MRWKDFVSKADEDKIPDIRANATADSLKDAGNACFRQSEWRPALNLYKAGLEKDATHVLLLSNASAAAMKLHDFETSLQYAEKGLQVDPRNAKCIFRKVVALGCLRRTAQACSFLDSLGEDTPDIAPARALAKQMNTEASEGIYDMRAINRLHSSGQGCATLCDHAEFISPKVELRDVPGKGRGYVALEAFKSGELVFATRAIGVGKEVRGKIGVEGQVLLSDMPGLLSVLARLDREPKLRRAVYKLMRRKESLSVEQPAIECEGEVPMDVDRIIDIYNTNCFSDPLTTKRSVRGLWLEPSFLNHSCVDFQCDWRILCDFIFIRVTRPVERGEEILVPYFTARLNFKSRRAIMEPFGYLCTCRLCEQEARIPASILGKREKCEAELTFVKDRLSDFIDQAQQMAMGNTGVFQRSAEALRKMIDTRRAMQTEGVCFQLVDPLICLAEYEVNIMLQFDRAITLLVEADQIVHNGLPPEPRLSYMLCYCYVWKERLGARNRQEHEHWRKQLRCDAQSLFGSEDYTDLAAPGTTKRAW